MRNYLLEKLSALQPLGGHRIRLTFRDGFTAEIDLAPLLDRGPLYEPLRDHFNSVHLEDGVPVWLDDYDFSPAALRAWCEAGRVLSIEETDEWVTRNSKPAARLA